MKRIVESDTRIGIVAGVASILVVAVTHASVGATYLIAFAFAVIAIAIRLGPERVQLWREEHSKGHTTKP